MLMIFNPRIIEIFENENAKSEKSKISGVLVGIHEQRV
jgi:hypothetical protein